MGEVTPAEGAPRSHSSSSSEMARFLRAFGRKALASLTVERKQAVEALLKRLAGVHAARVETTETGEIERIHVLAGGKFSPSQHAHHVRSALFAAHGLQIDPRLISLVPLKDEPEEDEEIEARLLGHLRARLGEISFQQEGFKVAAHVELDWQGKTFHGLSRETDTPKGRTMAAARAALNGLEKVAEERAAFLLESLENLRGFDRSIMVASVRVVSDHYKAPLVGCARALEDLNYAAAHAVLAAVNRYFMRLVVAPGSLEEHDRSAVQALDREAKKRLTVFDGF